MTTAENIKTVQSRIEAATKRAGRDSPSVKLVAVTKTVDVERIREAAAAGAVIFGENRVQEAKEKIEKLGNIASWHLIGRLQANKAKYAVKLFDLIHSVDNLALARELDSQAAKAGKIQNVLIEVNISGEAAKAGVAPGEVMALIRSAAALRNITIHGMMTVPPYSDNPEDSRRHFIRLRELSERVEKELIPNVSMRELSIGMSGDFEVAVEEGSTMVRVGTAIFGGRD